MMMKSSPGPDPSPSSSSSPGQSSVMMSRRKYTKPAEASRRWKRSISNLWSGSGSEGGGGVSTALKLYEDPWTIKKTLTESDLGRSSRLLLATDVVKSEILPMLGVDDARAAESEEGAAVRVWDLDSKSMHHLLLKRWSSSKSYVFIGKWNHDFVRRRNLHKGDLIAFHWDPSHSLFNFCVLTRATPPPPPPPPPHFFH